MVRPLDMEYLEHIAWQATKGIVGPEHAVPRGELYDGILSGLLAVVDDAHRRGLRESMVQLSLLPDAAHAVG